MNFLESFLLGLDEARRHFGQTILSLLGLVLGTASIVSVLALFGGQSTLTANFLQEMGGYGTIIVYDTEQSESPTAKELASERVTYRDAVYLKDHATTLYGVAPGWDNHLPYRAGRVNFTGEVVGTVYDYIKINDIKPMVGRFLSDLDVRRKSRVMVLGWAFADSLFGNPAAALGRLVNLNGKNFTVVGVLEREEFYFAPWSGNSLAWRNRRSYIPITTAFSQFTGDNDRLGFLTLKKTDEATIAGAESQVSAMLFVRHGVSDFQIVPSGVRGDDDTGQFLMLFNVIFLVIGVVSLFTGGVVIANILLASVVERVREFGTRMALGANGLHIFGQVLAQVLVVAIIGGLLGLGVGAALTGVVAHFMQLPAVVTPPIAGAAILTAITVGIGAGIYPAVRAARMSPVEALRFG